MYSDTASCGGLNDRGGEVDYDRDGGRAKGDDTQKRGVV